MHVLITGANGFLGHYLCRQLLGKKYRVTATGRGPNRLPFSGQTGFSYIPLDFTDPAETTAVMLRTNPDAIVHAGAMSRPDDCELERERAWQVNVAGTENLLQAAGGQNIYFLFVSTDFVFDGIRGMYSEEDDPGPVNYYGQTKREAELRVQQYPGPWSVVRTVLVYGPPLTGRPNILSIVREKLEKGEAYSVVDDQVRTPTYVEDLARGIVSLLEKRATGIYHLSGKDRMTPYEMAVATGNWLGLDSSLIRRVTASDFSQPARRPPLTGFCIDKARRELGYDPVSFAEGLRRTFSS